MPLSIRSTAEQLRTVARAATDASGYFPAMYSRVTERIAVSIEDGRFADGDRMDVFATTFASYFTRALEAGTGRPRCWQACWDVARDSDLLIVQHLLLGINAHVNHDLAQAVVEVAGPGGDLASVRGDFDAVNDVLAESYDDVLRSLDRVSRWANQAATVGGGRIFNFSLRVARSQAWGAAERIHALDTEGERAAYVAELDRLVSVLAYLITRPPLTVRPLLWVGRRLEEHDPRIVTATLLGEA
jgi:Family of unknown function (DUF5995)